MREHPGEVFLAQDQLVRAVLYGVDQRLLAPPEQVAGGIRVLADEGDIEDGDRVGAEVGDRGEGLCAHRRDADTTRRGSRKPPERRHLERVDDHYLAAVLRAARRVDRRVEDRRRRDRADERVERRPRALVRGDFDQVVDRHLDDVAGGRGHDRVDRTRRVRADRGVRGATRVDVDHADTLRVAEEDGAARARGEDLVRLAARLEGVARQRAAHRKDVVGRVRNPLGLDALRVHGQVEQNGDRRAERQSRVALLRRVALQRGRAKRIVRILGAHVGREGRQVGLPDQVHAVARTLTGRAGDAVLVQLGEREVVAGAVTAVHEPLAGDGRRPARALGRVLHREVVGVDRAGQDRLRHREADVGERVDVLVAGGRRSPHDDRTQHVGADAEVEEVRRALHQVAIGALDARRDHNGILPERQGRARGDVVGRDDDRVVTHDRRGDERGGIDQNVGAGGVDARHNGLSLVERALGLVEVEETDVRRGVLRVRRIHGQYRRAQNRARETDGD